VILGVLAGAYIGFGFSLCMLCAGQVSIQQQEGTTQLHCTA
jgi:hypothetical protein